MQILVQPTHHKSSSKSCNYTCPVYNTGIVGWEKLMELLKKKFKGGKSKDKGKICWYDN